MRQRKSLARAVAAGVQKDLDAAAAERRGAKRRAAAARDGGGAEGSAAPAEGGRLKRRRGAEAAEPGTSGDAERAARRAKKKLRQAAASDGDAAGASGSSAANGMCSIAASTSPKGAGRGRGGFSPGRGVPGPEVFGRDRSGVGGGATGRGLSYSRGGGGFGFGGKKPGRGVPGLEVWHGGKGGCGLGRGGAAVGEASAAREAAMDSPGHSLGRGHSRGRGGRGRGAGGADEARSRRPMTEILDYLRELAKSLEDASPEEEALLMSRAVEELGSRILLVAADQRGSKILEKLLRKGGAEAFTQLFKPLVEATPELAPNQYGSHVLEAALASWAERLGSKPDMPHQADKPPEGARGPPPVEPLVAMCKSLEEDGAWPALVDNACASHVVRSLLLALGGFSPDPQGKGKAAARAGLLPGRRHEVPLEVAELRRSVAGALVRLLREDPDLCLNAHASAAVQVLLRVLRDRGDRGLVADAVAAVVGASTVAGKPSAERCEALFRSAPGSRVLEVAVETASTEAYGALFTHVFRPRFQVLAAGIDGDFGPFLAQRIADGLREGPQLTLAVADLNFEVLLSAGSTPAQHAVVTKLLEASLRLNNAQKQLASEVFKALNLRSAAEHPRAWAALLLVDHSAEGPTALLAPAEKGWRKGAGKGSEEVGKKSNVVDKAADGASAGGMGERPLKLKPLPTAGPQLVSTLLRFSSEAVEPLNSGLPQLLASRQALRALALEPRTARVLEAALSPTSALLPSARLRLARAFRGLLGELGPHPVGGFVCGAVWKAALGEADLRQELAKELLEVKDILRTQNWAVWKVCGLYQAEVKQEEFAQKQRKAGKTKELFKEVLDGSNVEAAKAAAASSARKVEDFANREAEAQRRAVAKVDPMVASLLCTPARADKEDEAEDANTAAPGAAAEGDGAAAREIDELFSAPKKRRKRQVAEETNTDAASVQCVETAATGAAPLADWDLAKAMDIIAGREAMTKREKRKQRKRSKIANVAAKAAAKAKSGVASSFSSSEENDEPAAAKDKKPETLRSGGAAKRRKPNFTF